MHIPQETAQRSGDGGRMVSDQRGPEAAVGTNPPSHGEDAALDSRGRRRHFTSIAGGRRRKAPCNESSTRSACSTGLVPRRVRCMTEAILGPSLSDGWVDCCGELPDGVSACQNRAVGPAGFLARRCSGPGTSACSAIRKWARVQARLGGPHGDLSKAALTDFETIGTLLARRGARDGSGQAGDQRPQDDSRRQQLAAPRVSGAASEEEMRARPRKRW